MFPISIATIISILLMIYLVNGLCKEFCNYPGLIIWIKKKLSTKTLATLYLTFQFLLMICIGFFSAFILDLIFLRLI
jgi:hypothetical protein